MLIQPMPHALAAAIASTAGCDVSDVRQRERGAPLPADIADRIECAAALVAPRTALTPRGVPVEVAPLDLASALVEHAGFS